MDFKVRRSGHIVLRVADVERSARFFQDLLGLELIGSQARISISSIPTAT